MLLTLYLLPFNTAALLRYAFAHIAQSNQDLVLPNSPVAPSHNRYIHIFYSVVNDQMLTEDPSTTKGLLREDPPLRFKVEYKWKEGGKSFDHIAFCDTIVENVAVLTAEPWDKDMNIVQFPPTYHIRIGFVSDRSGPGLQVKHVVWALAELFVILVENNRFSVGSIVVNSNWDAGRLAVGTITMPGSGFGLNNASDMLSTTPSSSKLEDSIKNNSMSDSNVTSPSPSLQLFNTTQSNMRTVQLPALNQTSDSVSPRPYTEDRLGIQIKYTPGGAAFHDVQIYNASLQLLVQIAQVADQKGTVWPLISTYNDLDDFTLSVAPTNFAKHSELSWGDVATVLAYLGLAMSSQGKPGHIWAELEGIIRTDKIFTGVLCIAKGDRTGWRPAAMCPRPGLDSIYNDDIVATTL